MKVIVLPNKTYIITNTKVSNHACKPWVNFINLSIDIKVNCHLFHLNDKLISASPSIPWVTARTILHESHEVPHHVLHVGLLPAVVIVPVPVVPVIVSALVSWLATELTSVIAWVLHSIITSTIAMVNIPTTTTTMPRLPPRAPSLCRGESEDGLLLTLSVVCSMSV